MSSPVRAQKKPKNRKRDGAGSHYAIGAHPIKVAVNTWLSQTAALLLPDCGSQRALVLDTHKLITASSLVKRTPFSMSSIMLPNPSDEECGSMIASQPSLNVFCCTSHQLIDALANNDHSALLEYRMAVQKSEDGTSNETNDKLAEGEGEESAHEARETLAFVWLDYCGTLHSAHGKYRMRDLLSLFKYSLLSRSRSMLALTFAMRGSPLHYQDELVDEVVVAALTHAQTHGYHIQVLACISYRITAPMHTIVFEVTSSSDALCSLDSLPSFATAPTEGRERCTFHLGWSVYGGNTSPTTLAACVDCVASHCMRSTSHVFTTVGSSGTPAPPLLALLMDYHCLPLTRTLAETDVDILLVVPTAQRHTLSSAILQAQDLDTERVHVCVSHIKDALSSAASRGSVFDIMWLSYFDRRPFTHAELEACAQWSDIGYVFSHSLLRQAPLGSVLGIHVNVVSGSGGELWLHSPLDLLVQGVSECATNHGYPRPIVLSVSSFDVVHRRLCVCLYFPSRGVRLSDLSDDALRVESAQFQHDRLLLANSWNLDRPKKPTVGHTKYKSMASSVLAALRDAGCSRVCVAEPGLHYVVPLLVREGLAVQVAIAGLNEGDDEKAARGFGARGACALMRARAESEGFALMDSAKLGEQEGLVLLEEGGCGAWQRAWSCVVARWLHARALAPCSLLVLHVTVESKPAAVDDLVRGVQGEAQRIGYTVTVVDRRALRSTARSSVYCVLGVKPQGNPRPVVHSST